MILTENSIPCRNAEEVQLIAIKNKLQFGFSPIEGAVAVKGEMIVAYWWKQQSGNPMSDLTRWLMDDN